MAKHSGIAYERARGRLLTKETAMKRLGIKKSKYYELLWLGEFGDYVRVGQSIRIHEHELGAYIQRNTADPLN